MTSIDIFYIILTLIFVIPFIGLMIKCFGIKEVLSFVGMMLALFLVGPFAVIFMVIIIIIIKKI